MPSSTRPVLTVVAAGLAALVAGAWRASTTGTHGLAGKSEAAAASEVVVSFLRMSAHLRGSRGDDRFAERLPAARDVVEELLAETDALTRAGVTETPRLLRADVRVVTPLADDAVEVFTREYWITDVAGEGRGPERTRSDVVDARYAVVHEPGGWRVAAWRLDTGDGERERAR